MNDKTIKTLKAQKFSVLAKLKGEFYKLFQIIFNKNKANQFSIIVSFPYFKENKGILSKLTHSANSSTPQNLSLQESGSLSSYLVKYSHWEDGNTHFSQDGKVYTTIKNKSIALDKVANHIFTIQLQGLSGFEKKDNLIKKQTKKNTEIDFDIKNQDNMTLKFTGWWFDMNEIDKSTIPGGPELIYRMQENEIKRGLALSPTYPKYPSLFLFLSAELKPLLNKDDKTLLTFIGGFDKTKRIDEDASFLSFIYPTSDFEQLKSQLPSIDYI